ncbi:phospholipid phosphatase-related protein type 2-like, partial [Onychostruthus taczanowskii]|uniref:phospholipid phosphatase-related protein type 2-like n=1 Tax=Onychostruthus taczanowskii TaxID=356909 RepID=UPI001B8070BD
GVFSFGLLATAIFANAGQVVLGTPAPHFLAVCRPNYSALGCAGPPGTPPHFVPPGGSPCSGDPPAVAAARRDFPCKEA